MVMKGTSGSPGSITAFFPCYNDGDCLREMIPQAVECLGRITSDFEVIVVDDGSGEDTRAVLDTLESQYACLRVERHPRNLGYGAALQTGFRKASKDWVFYTDGDGQYDVREFERLWSLAGQSADVIVGYKTQRADTWLRRVIGKIYNVFVRILFHLKVKDVDCDFRLLRSRVLRNISLTASSGAICVDLMSQIQDRGVTILETPVNHYPRKYGKSHFFRVLPVLRTGLDLLSLCFRHLRRQPRSFSHVRHEPGDQP